MVAKPRYWFLVPLLILALLLAACEPAEEEPLEPGVEPGVDLTEEVEPGVEVTEPVEPGVEVTEPVEPGVEAGAPLLIQSSTLVGMPVAFGEEALAADDTLDAEATTEVSDILVAPDGTIQYVILDSAEFLGEDIGFTGQAAVPWTAFQPDPANERLLLTMPPADLQNQVTQFDEAALTNDDGIIDADEAGTLGLTGDFERLIRMGGALRDFQIVNAQGEDLGEVEQGILNLQTGEVIYAVADFGGFLGLAEHTVAVPWDRLQVMPAAADEAGATFQLNVTQEQLEAAPTFDETDFAFFPNAAAEDFDAEIQGFWQTVTAEAEEPGVAEPGAPLLMQSSTLVGMEIIGAAGENIAEVSNILVAPDGTIAFIMFDAGGFLGIGERNVIVPWGDFTFSAEEEAIVLPFTQDQVEALTEIAEADLGDDDFIDAQEAEGAGLFDAGQDDAGFEGLIRMGGALRDFEIVGTNGNDLGEVEQGILDVSQGQMLYGVADFGGFLGLAEHTLAVPWNVLQIAPELADEEGATFLLPVTEEQMETLLEDAPEFNVDTWTFWPEPAAEGFDAETRGFWRDAGLLGEAAAEPGAEMAEGPMLIQSSTLVGLPVGAAEEAGLDDELVSAEATTEVSDILVAADGTIAFIVFDATDFLGEFTGNVAVPWSAIQPDPANGQLLLNVSPQELDTMVTPFDEAALGEDDGLIGEDEATEAGLTAEFENLIRMGGTFRDFQIISAEGQDLGEVEQAILDLSAGQAVYAVTDFGGFLGLGEHTVAVPWNRLTVVPEAADEPGATFQLPVTDPDILETAPTFNEGEWTFWPNAANEDFDAETQAFWETAG